jgi:hypothetical protein
MCGNEYDKAFEIIMNDKRYTFDSFECAVHMLAPLCASCSCRILGHGVEQSGIMYCCAACAVRDGATDLRDRA